MLSSPFEAQASLFSIFSADPVYAQTDAPTPIISSNKNSQNIDLLQANVSSASVIQDKSTKNSKTTKDDKASADKKTIESTSSKKVDNTSSIDQNVTVKIVSNNAMLPATGPLGGASNAQEIADSSSDQASLYVVRKGDTIAAIADMFDVSVNTILAANDMKKGEKLVEGDVLFILPITGVEHVVAKGQTLQSIAKIYKVDVNDLVLYNDIPENGKLVVGDKIMIPGADNMSDEGGDKPAPNLVSAPSRDKNYYDTHPIASLSGFFINPLPTGHKTQGLHGPGHRGIDIGAPTGTPMYAAASGNVLIVKTGCVQGKSSCGGGYGNMAIIQHANGTKTLYGHMSKVATHTGDHVNQGEVIGYVGSTGHSTGPHLHFEVFNAKNPGSDWSWSN